MRLLDRSQDESAPMQACAAHLNPVKTEENPISRAAMLQPVGYVPVNRPPTRYSVEDLKKELTLTNIWLAALLILNPFVLAPLASIVDPEYGFMVAFIFVVIGVGSAFVVPILWIMGIVRTFKRRNQINDLIEEGQTPPTEFWYYLVYNRLPDGYTGRQWLHEGRRGLFLGVRVFEKAGTCKATRGRRTARGCRTTEARRASCARR